MLSKYFAIILISISFFSCKDDKSIQVEPEVLGILNAKIDSLNNFKINLDLSTIDTSTYNTTKIINIEAVDNGSNTLILYLPARDTGSYMLAQGVESTIRYISKQGVMYRGKSGNVHITKVDFINKKLSGTFTAKLLQTGSTDTIYLTEGVFVDLPLPKKQ